MTSRIVFSVRSQPEAAGGPWCARSCRTPDASSCACSENRSAEYDMHRVHPQGLYQTQIPRPTDTIDYEYLVQEDGRAPYRCSDPYRFRHVRFTAEDERLFVRGEHTPAVRKARRAADHARRRAGRRVRRVGTERAARQRRRHLRRLGRPPTSDATRRRLRRLGAVRPRRRPGRPLQIRDQDLRRRRFPEVRPVRHACRAAAEPRLDRP